MVQKLKILTKDFLEWARLKIKLQNTDQPPFFYEREIWWTAIGHNIGFEQDGKGVKFARPVLVVRKFNQYMFWGIPLTSANKKGRYYFRFRYKEGLKSGAVLSQLRAFDSKRLLDKDGTMKQADFSTLQTNLIEILKKNAQK